MVRSNRGEKLLERARRSRGTSWARLTREPQTAELEQTEAKSGLTDAPASDQPGSDADPSLDVAVYSCSCGLVFEAPVSTSVGCPHCGGHLAW